MTKLKSIVLKECLNLTETPDFSGVPNLEHLLLGRCTSLVKVHSSLGQLRKLIEVDLNDCVNLEILPKKLETNSLVKLNLRGCEKVVELPEFGEGKEKLSYLDVSDTFLTRLPESVGSLTGLEYLNLSDCLGYFNLSDCEVENPYITHQIFGLNATSLTELYLSQCGLDDGSIPDFASLSLLIVLDLSGNDFVNLPIGCFSSLSQLVFLSLNDCQCLESLPRLPPRLIRLNASGCDLMEPLSSNGQLWNLVASLDHECRGRTKYEVYDDEEDAYFVPFEAGKWPPRLRDFCAILPGYEIPSWFSNQKDGPLDEYSRVYEIELDIEHEIQQDIEFRIEVDIPPYFRDSEWCGIVVCFLMSAKDNVFCTVGWRSKAAEDDDVYIPEDWVHYIPFAFSENLCIMVLELNEETCWRHLRAHHSNSLHILFSFRPFLEEIWRDLEGVKCGWSVMCKEKIQDWCQLASSDEVKHPERVLHQFFRKVEFLIQEPEKNG